jgi:DNA mismatch endonuclease (patch repair protein)
MVNAMQLAREAADGDAEAVSRSSDVYDQQTRSRVMRAVKSRDTTPEMTVRKAVWAIGGRYRLHRKDLPGAPDLAFPGRRKAIFVHGCFWHGHDCARGARVPRTNRDYWTAKIAGNKARDERNRCAYAEMGWDVLCVWECETRDPALKPRLAAFLGIKCE